MKNNESNIVMRSLAPRVVTKALAALDQSTAIVVGICWAVALVALVAALLAVHSVVAAKQDATNAMIAEPALPVATTTKVTQQEGQVLVERLQHQFPEVKIETDNSPAIIIKADDGSKFHQWITALVYLDTMSPQYRWTLRAFCVGHCPGSDLMKAEVTGQKVIFSLPPKP